MLAEKTLQRLKKRGTVMVPRFFVYLLVSSIVFLPACTKRRVPLSVADKRREALMHGMPLPVGGTLLPLAGRVSTPHAEQSIVRYKVPSSRETVQRFYDKEMMRLGWHKKAQSSQGQDIMVFESPTHIALVQIAPEKKNHVMLTLHRLVKE